MLIAEDLLLSQLHIRSPPLPLHLELPTKCDTSFPSSYGGKASFFSIFPLAFSTYFFLDIFSTHFIIESSFAIPTIKCERIPKANHRSHGNMEIVFFPPILSIFPQHYLCIFSFSFSGIRGGISRIPDRLLCFFYALFSPRRFSIFILHCRPFYY